MTSETIRWIIAGLFVAFLVVIVLSDLIHRRPKKTRIGNPRPRGFQRGRRQSKVTARSSWKKAPRA